MSDLDTTEMKKFAGKMSRSNTCEGEELQQLTSLVISAANEIEDLKRLVVRSTCPNWDMSEMECAD